jgi:hypothetical protein
MNKHILYSLIFGFVFSGSAHAMDPVGKLHYNYNYNNNNQPQKSCQTLEHDNNVLKGENEQLKKDNARLMTVIAHQTRYSNTNLGIAGIIGLTIAAVAFIFKCNFGQKKAA